MILHSGFRLGLTIGLLVIASGCAASYGESGWMSKSGYSETRLAADLYEITYTGNAYIRDDTLQDYAWLRTARLCQNKGFTHFVVLSAFHESLGTSATTSVMEKPVTIDGTTYFSEIPPSYKMIARFYKSAPPPLASDAEKTAQEIKARRNIF